MVPDAVLVATSVVDSAVIEEASPVEVNPPIVIDPILVADTSAVVEPAAMLEPAETVETSELVGLVSRDDTPETVPKAEAVVIAESVEPTIAEEPKAFSQMYDLVMSHFESSHFSVLSILTQS